MCRDFSGFSDFLFEYSGFYGAGKLVPKISGKVFNGLQKINNYKEEVTLSYILNESETNRSLSSVAVRVSGLD